MFTITPIGELFLYSIIYGSIILSGWYYMHRFFYDEYLPALQMKLQSRTSLVLKKDLFSSLYEDISEPSIYFFHNMVWICVVAFIPYKVLSHSYVFICNFTKKPCSFDEKEHMYKVFMLVCGGMATLYYFGFMALVIQVSVPIAMYVVVLMHPTYYVVLATFIASIISLWTGYVDAICSAMSQSDPYLCSTFHIMYSFNLMNVMSFLVSYIWQTDEKNANDSSSHDELHAYSIQYRPGSHSFLDLLAYIFYPPFLFGPVWIYTKYHYEVFYKQRYAEGQQTTIKQLTLGFYAAIDCLVFYIMNRVLARLFFSHSLNYADHFGLPMPPAWTAYPFLVLYHIQFQSLYRFQYGLPVVLALLDGGAVGPLTPRCVLRYVTSGDRWRYFDAGMYDFMKTCIYIPLGGSRHGIWRQLAASVITFAITSIWHGARTYIMIWSALNVIGVTIDILCFHFWRSQRGLEWKTWQGDWYLRTSAVGRALWFSIMSSGMTVISVGDTVAKYQFISLFSQPLVVIGYIFHVLWLYCYEFRIKTKTQ